MGIRFICPECDNRLNVKSFLAGKKGFCPKCNARIEIPSESTISSPKKPEEAQNGATPQKESVVASEAASAASAPSQATAGNESLEPTPPASVDSTPAQAAPTAQSSSQETPSQQTSRALEEAPHEPAIPEGGPTPADNSASPAPQVLKPINNSSAETVMETLPRSEIATQLSSTSTEESAPESAAPSVLSTSDQEEPRATEPLGGAPALRDPIDDSPTAIWYVRPPSGGQFGPADGQRMKRWIDEGRISGDSLVWREGWEDWQLAASIFPTLSPGPSETAASENVSPAKSSVSVDIESSSEIASQYTHKQKKSKTFGVVALVALALMCVALAVVLGVVLSQ